MVNSAMQLAEGGQGSSAHPHDEVLVLVAYVVPRALVPNVYIPVGGMGVLVLLPVCQASTKPVTVQKLHLHHPFLNSKNSN